VTWAGEALAAIRKIILIEERVNALTEQVKRLADAYLELDRRLLRIEAKFELVERISGGQRKGLPARSTQKKKPPKAR
jgi:hypothetical protein